MADLFLWRRHLKTCAQSKKGRKATKCRCPVWCDGYVDGKRVKESMGTNDWTRAEWKLSKMVAPEGVDKLKRGKPLEEAINSYLEDCTARKLQPSTLTSYRNTLDAFVSFCGSEGCFDANTVTIDTITAFRSTRVGKTQRQHTADCLAAKNRADRRKCQCPVVARKPTSSTLRKELELLRGFSSFCKVRKWMDENPAEEVKQTAEQDSPTLPFEQHEVELILAACASTFRRGRDRLRAYGFLMLLLYSGFRVSDAAKFSRDKLNIETGRFVVRAKKNGEQVMFTLQPPALAALLAVPIENERYFFWSGEDASDLDTCIKSLRRSLDAIRRKTGINVHPHRFRDTFAVRLLEHDVAIRTVQKLLGHKSVTTTEKYYAKWVKSHQRLLDEAAATLDFVAPASGLYDPPEDALRNTQGNVVSFRSEATA